MARDYKQNRRAAPPIEDIFSQRKADIGFPGDCLEIGGVRRQPLLAGADR
jgi:hypothetical protein